MKKIIYLAIIIPLIISGCKKNNEDINLKKNINAKHVIEEKIISFLNEKIAKTESNILKTNIINLKNGLDFNGLKISKTFLDDGYVYFIPVVENINFIETSKTFDCKGKNKYLNVVFKRGKIISSTVINFEGEAVKIFGFSFERSSLQNIKLLEEYIDMDFNINYLEINGTFSKKLCYKKGKIDKIVNLNMNTTNQASSRGCISYYWNTFTQNIVTGEWVLVETHYAFSVCEADVQDVPQDDSGGGYGSCDQFAADIAQSANINQFSGSTTISDADNQLKTFSSTWTVAIYKDLITDATVKSTINFNYKKNGYYSIVSNASAVTGFTFSSAGTVVTNLVTRNTAVITDNNTFITKVTNSVAGTIKSTLSTTWCTTDLGSLGYDTDKSFYVN